jgi:hypothetical protein
MRDIIDAIVRVSGCKGYDAQLPDANDRKSKPSALYKLTAHA